jgi:hypothetical protein
MITLSSPRRACFTHLVWTLREDMPRKGDLYRDQDGDLWRIYHVSRDIILDGPSANGPSK